MKKETVWSVFKKIVNSKEINSIISRQEIIEQMSKEGFFFQDNSDVSAEEKESKNKIYSTATIDNARNMSEKVGYLSKTEKNGVYMIRNHFPEKYTISQLRKDYNRGVNVND